MKYQPGRLVRWIGRRWGRLTIVIVMGILGFLGTSEHVAIWPVRNTLSYRLYRWWNGAVRITPGNAELRGCVRDQQGEAVAGASVLVSEAQGQVHHTRTGDDGCYQLSNLPAQRYVPVVSAPGYETLAVKPWGFPISLSDGERQVRDIQLEPVTIVPVDPGSNLMISSPVTLTVDLPRRAEAVRRQVSFEREGKPNQLTYVYVPVGATGPVPTLLAVYPGPADQWEGVSIPLAAGGYAVVAVGPEYSLDLDADIRELQRLTAFVRAGSIPGAAPDRIVLLAGSYSSLHVQRLLRYDTNFRGLLLLGPLSDLFDFRKRFEAGTFMPPFGLDEALIALGWPNTATERYHRYSSIYHIRPDWPPILLMHSKTDEIVPYQQSELLIAEFKRLGLAYEPHFFEGMSHYLRTDGSPEELDKLYTITLDFLERTLK